MVGSIGRGRCGFLKKLGRRDPQLQNFLSALLHKSVDILEVSSAFPGLGCRLCGTGPRKNADSGFGEPNLSKVNKANRVCDVNNSSQLKTLEMWDLLQSI